MRLLRGGLAFHLPLTCYQFISPIIPVPCRVPMCRNTPCSDLGGTSLSWLGLVSHHTSHHARSLPAHALPCQAGAPTLNRAQTSLSSLSRAHSFFLAASWSWELRHWEERLSTEKKSEISDGKPSPTASSTEEGFGEPSAASVAASLGSDAPALPSKEWGHRRAAVKFCGRSL